MKVYLVGGAVRDELLNLKVKEKDWVVVGASPEQLKKLNYRQVGKDFPVFLHPLTHEEYALARTEKKSGPGYHGFTCDFHPNITLEEDLFRRDLTINAIAKDEDGQLVDPYSGITDIKRKMLRHVSPAFIEDPVRVLRVARFAARFYSLGFRIANDTRKLMYAMVTNGELNHLTPERVWQEFKKSLEEANPEQFILALRSCAALKIILPEIDKLFGIPNPQKYHQEIDSGIHSLLVLKAAVKLSADPHIRFAALIHDLGKGATPIQNWPSHHGHEDLGVPLVEHLCNRLKVPVVFKNLAVMVSRFHLLIHRLSELTAKTIVKVLEQTDAFRRPQNFYNLLIVCQADAEGCGREITYNQSSQWQYILTECVKIQAKDLISQGIEGLALKEGLYQRRIACVKLIQNSWKNNEK